jgi:hypothetical protein
MATTSRRLRPPAANHASAETGCCGRRLSSPTIAGDYPNIAAMPETISHDADTSLGWCDDQFEFEFALDVLLEGLERRRDTETSRSRKR